MKKITGEDLHNLDNAISYWESELHHHRFLLSPSVQYFLEVTIKFLKMLKEITHSGD